MQRRPLDLAPSRPAASPRLAAPVAPPVCELEAALRAAPDKPKAFAEMLATRNYTVRSFIVLYMPDAENPSVTVETGSTPVIDATLYARLGYTEDMRIKNAVEVLKGVGGSGEAAGSTGEEGPTGTQVI
jgi:hypothetical protein